jgi:hypothetical protein
VFDGGSSSSRNFLTCVAYKYLCERVGGIWRRKKKVVKMVQIVFVL